MDFAKANAGGKVMLEDLDAGAEDEQEQEEGEIESDYFKRRVSKWNILDFLRECKLEPFQRKIDSYLSDLEKISSCEEDHRQRKARELLARYKEGTRPDRKEAKLWSKSREAVIHLYGPTFMSGGNVNGAIIGNVNGTLSINRQGNREEKKQSNKGMNIASQSLNKSIKRKRTEKFCEAKAKSGIDTEKENSTKTKRTPFGDLTNVGVVGSNPVTATQPPFDEYTSWELDGEPPSWLSKAIREYKSLTFETPTQAINWRIVNASDRNYLLTFLTEAEFLSLNNIFGSAVNGWKILAPAAERCLQTLAKLNSNQLQSIGRIILVEGVRGAVKQTLHLVESTMVPEISEDPSLDDDDDDDKSAASVELLKEEDCDHIDVCYIFNLLRYCCEMLDKGIPQRNNSERDIDIAIKTYIFSCLDDILDKHYGEMVSRASRNRRALAIGASKNADGYHVDWLFSRHDLAKDLAWGREFALCERAGSTVDNKQKISSDTLKVQKTLRDMHQSLYDAITEAGNGVLSKFVLSQTTKLLMPGFISSYFSVRTFLVLYVGAGFYASSDLVEFNIPTTTKEIGNILEVARIMLQIKKIMSSTVARFKRIKERAALEKFGSGNIAIHGRQPEPVSPQRK